MYDAILIAVKLHDGAKHKRGNPYVCHVIEVAKRVHLAGLPEFAEVAALYHDLVEDVLHDPVLLGDYIPSRFENEEFGKIMTIVSALTYYEDRETKLDAVKGLGNYGVPREAVVIKMADMIDNFDEARKGKKEKNMDRVEALWRIFKDRYPVESITSGPIQEHIVIPFKRVFGI